MKLVGHALDVDAARRKVAQDGRLLKNVSKALRGDAEVVKVAVDVEEAEVMVDEVEEVEVYFTIVSYGIQRIRRT